MLSLRCITYVSLASLVLVSGVVYSDPIEPKPAQPSALEIQPTKDTRSRAERVTVDENGRFQYDWPAAEDLFIQAAPLGDINSWINEQWRESAMALHGARFAQRRKMNPGSDIRMDHVINIQRSKKPLSDEQWKMLIDRVADEIQRVPADQLMPAYSIVLNITQLSGDAPLFDFDKVNAAIEIRIFDPDTKAAKLAAGMLFDTNKYLSSAEEASSRVLLLLSAIEQAKPGDARAAMIQALQSISYKYGYAGHDAEVLDLMHTIQEDPNLNGLDRANVFMAIGSAKGDLKEAATKAAKGLESSDDATRRLSLLTLQRLSSFYENKDPVSRQQALEIAIPAITKLFRSNPSDHTAQSIMGYCRHFREHAAPWVPDIIRYLDHPDFNIQGSAIMALTDIGPLANEALPKLRSMNGTRGNLNEPIRDALYFIAKEGDKPDWYDNYIQHLRDAGIEID